MQDGIIMSNKRRRVRTRRQAQERRRPTPALKLVLIEEGRDPQMTAATWVITPNVDNFVGDYNKIVAYFRNRAKKNRASWDAENNRIFEGSKSP